MAIGIVLWWMPVAHAQYRYSTWTAEDGLPQNVVRGLTQTPNGYLWIATLDGLVRFDGVRFSVFNKKNTDGIATNRFVDMYMAPNGDLWLPTEGGHLTRVRNGVFHTYEVDTLGITGDDAGHVWVLLHNNVILKWDEAADRFSERVATIPGIRYRQLRWKNAGFWAADADGLHCFIRGHKKDYPLPVGVKFDNVGVVAVDDVGGLWLETGDKRHIHVTPDGAAGPLSKPEEAISGSFRDVHGHAWNVHVGFHLNRTLEVPVSGKMVAIDYSMIFEDREQNLWLGTEGGGLYQIHKESIRMLSKEQGLVDRNVYPIFQDRAGAIWAGAWGPGGLSRLDAHGIMNFTPKEGLPNGGLTALAQDRDGRIWMGSHAGVAVMEGEKFVKVPQPELPVNAVVQVIDQARDGTMWFGTTMGLVAFHDGISQLFTMQNGLVTNDIHTIAESPDGGLWIGGYGGLARLVRGVFSHWTERDGLPSNMVRSLYEDGDGVLWIGTYDGGLGRLKNGKFTTYTEREGLFNNGVFRILEDGHGDLWISCNRGIYRLNKKELNDFAEDKTSSITSVGYGKADGMLNVECNGGVWPSGIKAVDGTLWFPTQDGIAILDPESVRRAARPPPVEIESITSDYVPLPLTGAIRIPAGRENLEVAYTGLSFINSKEIRFRYKLEGHDVKWVEAGQRRTAYYSHLPPGHYVFRVNAVNSDGIWNMEGRSVALTILAPFYLTWWFTALWIVAGALLVYGAWHRRVSQLERSKALQQTFSRQLIASQESERKRIAGELHDGIGQRLVVINNLAQMAKKAAAKAGFTGDGSERITEIHVEALAAINEARDISYNLRPFQLDRLGLTKAVVAMLRSVSGASGIAVSSSIDDIDEVFAEEMRINFYRIVQESLNNVMKHSHADEVDVTVRRESDKVVLIVRDNGCGIVERAEVQGAGFGMTGMSERASLLGGRLEVRSAAGQGTVVCVTIAVGGQGHD